jgi:hypothetical protein
MGQLEEHLHGGEQIRHFTVPRKPSDSKRESKAKPKSKSKAKNNSNINSKNNSNSNRKTQKQQLIDAAHDTPRDSACERDAVLCDATEVLFVLSDVDIPQKVHERIPPRLHGGVDPNR